MGVHTPLMPRHRRFAIEGEIEMHLQRVELLIARLDRADAPLDDLEDDDPAGDPLDERGEEPTDNGSEILRMLPMWSVDQTSGPINERAARRARYRDMMTER